ncbi:MAG: EamA family transporter [Candidatus Paceibacterota bacterium]
MTWFFIALLAPVFWSISTHFDKYILSRYSKRGGMESVFLFSTFFSLIFALFIFSIKYNEIISYSEYQNILLFVIPGILNALGLYFYLKSLKNEESSIVVALFQVSPVFAYFLSYLILGEILTKIQIFASIIILLGATILSFNIEEKRKILVKWEMVRYILLAALFFALNDVIFKEFTISHGSFITSLFYQHIGIFIVGLLFFLFKKHYKEDFILLLKNNKIKIFVLNGATELSYVLGNLISNFVMLSVPVALVLIVNTYQTVFTFTIGLLLTLFLPHIVTEKISKRHLIQKILAITIIIIGSYFLYLS